MLEALITGFIAGALAMAAWHRWQASSAGGAPPEPEAEPAPVEEPPAVEAPDGPTDVLQLAEWIQPLILSVATPRDLGAHPDFDRAAGILAGSDLGTDALLEYANGSSDALCYIATEALGRRQGAHDVAPTLLRMLPDRYGWRRFFLLRALHGVAAGPVLGATLARLDPSWSYDPDRGWLREFATWRLAAGEEPVLGHGVAALDELTAEQRAVLDQLIPGLADVLPAPLIAAYGEWRTTRVDVSFLRSIGHVFDDADAAAAEAVIEHDALRQAVSRLEGALCGSSPRASVLTGDAGVGKSAVLARLSLRLRERGWLVFRCTASDLLAGQVYVGQIEDRIAALMRELKDRNVLWIVDGFHELLYAGRTVQNPAGLLDHIFPYLERGGIRVAGEAPPAAYEKLLQQRPRLRSLLETVRLEPLPGAEARLVTREWARDLPIAAAELELAHQLAAHHLAEQQAPGNVLTLLRRAVQAATSRNGAPAAVERQDVLAALSALTGLPLDILDERTALDLGAVRSFFAGRVLGQDEAVDALVERLALIKAGLTDPSRPQGVFLFVGPTGTGKTELAKALAEYLFGSADRMIRLDMSEFQEPGTVHRLLGSPAELEAGSTLVDAVRRQPFSVVLFDELEKAEPRIWDLFLQLFDDGRLTDYSGNTASFRNAIVIMTSNLGAGGRSAGIGFGQADTEPTSPSVQHALDETFRPEFINRIDRVVPFRPLPRSIMRRLLDKEIREVLERRGLRDRGWALEWEESAIELLISHGFSPSLGARPLKRAVERYLLAPLAVSIVGHRVPEGDQFLYITAAGDRLQVEFVDPDEASPGPASTVVEPADDIAIEDIVRDGRGLAAEIDALAAEYDHIRGVLDGPAWHERKDRALAAMSDADFWNSPRRFRTLGLVEYMDRIEVGAETAGSLLHRLTRTTQDGTSSPPLLVRRLAQQLYLVGEALDGVAREMPRDAFLRVVAAHDPGVEPARADDFARRLAAMYVAWAERRGMRLDTLAEATSPACVTLAISGFAAYPILLAEQGQHVLEVPAAGHTRSHTRARALVFVAPQPDEPPGPRNPLAGQASRALDRIDAQRLDVIRRYREEPSPLVRDLVAGWRTGRIDLVLEGHFDVMG